MASPYWFVYKLMKNSTMCDLLYLCYSFYLDYLINFMFMFRIEYGTCIVFCILFRFFLKVPPDIFLITFPAGQIKIPPRSIWKSALLSIDTWHTVSEVYPTWRVSRVRPSQRFSPDAVCASDLVSVFRLDALRASDLVNVSLDTWHGL